MQKKLIAVAIAAISAAPAFAQSNVTIYGRVDYGFMSRSGSSGGVDIRGTKNEMASGIQAGSRIGFKGSEDLGNGLKAIFQAESGLQNDANNGGSSAGIWSGALRNIYVGVTGNLGTVVGGRLDGVRYGVYNKYDAFAGGGMGNFTQMTLQVDRADNAIAYVSPNWSGFSLVLAHSRDTAGQEFQQVQTLNNTVAVGASSNTGDGLLYTIKGGYDNGPISIDVGYETIKYDSSNAALAGNIIDDQVVYYVGASYDFGKIKVRGLLDHHHADGSNNFSVAPGVKQLADYDAWFLSATMPVGNFLLKATYGQIDENRNLAERAAGIVQGGDATKWGIGANYNLSKRTNVYVDYAQISNDRTANYTINPAANAQQVGYGTKGFNMGLAHNF